MKLDCDFVTPLAEVVEKEIAAGIPLGGFHQQWLIANRAPTTVREQLRLGRERHWLQMARQGFMSQDVNDVNTAAFGAIASTASESNVVGATQALINQFCAIAANDARAGKTYRVTSGGIYSNTATPTIIWTPRWGSSTTPATNVTLGASATWTSITGTTNLPWFLEFEFDVWTAPPGATLGTGMGFGEVQMGIPVTNSQLVAGLYIGSTAATIDTTGQGAAGCGLTMNMTWGTSSSSNTLTCKSWKLRSSN